VAEDQRAIEAADTMPFEIYRQEYVSERRLGRATTRAFATGGAVGRA
jgi:glutamate--cysteine ligase